MVMKYILILFFILGFNALSTADPGAGEVGKAWLQAFNANDLEGVVALYAPDAHLFPPDEVEAVGTAAIRANYAATFKNYTVKEAKMIDPHHKNVGDLSYAWGRFSVTLVPKAGGEAITMEGRFSDVSQKINGKWLYIVDHASLNPPPPASQPAND
jgi:uncharacterized protein (TIGR02246 family)